MSVTRPQLPPEPRQLTCERQMTAPPHELFPAWTTNRIGRWFAAAETVLMKPEVNVPFFFETRFDGQRHPHYGRFLRLEPDRLVEMVWVTAAGTRGVETVVTVELEPSGEGTRLRLSHVGFPDDDSKEGHEEGWPMALAELEKAFGGGS